MTAQQRSEKSIFLQAIDIGTPEQRVAFLAEACGSNDHLRAEIDALLCAHGQSHGLLDAPNVTVDQPISERPGTVIGPYKLLEQIGEGGMGVVFMAEQFRPMQRKVALKIVKPGMDTKEVVARFEAERQALALMDHPNIARVLDAGATESGRPYFVMELVHGVPINEYCNQHRLSIRERLELFTTVCQAVQHAHQKGIIHRDLKPSNILVTQRDGKPQVKVIDFGVAKATGQKLTDKTLFTGFAQLVGTPLYMSPEQAEMSEPDVDTRSDIYSLGVLLYELLTGHTPFDSQRLKSAAFDEFRRIIREEEPPRPSTRFSSLSLRETSGLRVPENADVKETANLASTIAEQRRVSDPRHLSKLFRGELDWIVMKSLEKDRNRRYETASAMAADVERYLNDEPVQACPPSAMYRFRKFARRNRGAILAGSLLALMLLVVVGAIAASIGWVARDRATRQAVLGQQITQALDESKTWHHSEKLTEALSAVKRAEELLNSGGGSDELRQQVTLWRTELEAVKRLDQIRSDLVFSLGKGDRSKVTREYGAFFQGYGIDLEKLSIDESALLIRNSPIKQDLIAALDAWTYFGRSEAKELPHKKALQIARLVDPDPWRDRVRELIESENEAALLKLAGEKDIVAQPLVTVLMLSHALDARKNYQAAIDLLKPVQLKHPNDFWINNELAWKLDMVQPPRTEESIGFLRAAVSIRPDSAAAYANLGNKLAKHGDLAEADAAFREAIRLDQTFADAHYNHGEYLFQQEKYAQAEVEFREAIRLKPDKAISHCGLGNALLFQGKNPEAEVEYRESIRLQPANPKAFNNLSHLLFIQKKFAEAEEAAKESIRLEPDYETARNNLANALIAQGKYAEAEPECREAIRIKPDYAEAHFNLGRALAFRSKGTEAEAEYREAIRLKPDHIAAHVNLARILDLEGKCADAEAEYREVIRLEPNYANAHKIVGGYLFNQKKYTDAEVECREAIRLEPNDEQAHHLLGMALNCRGKYAEAEAEFREAVRLKPEGREVLNSLAWLLATCPEPKVRDTSQAVQLAQKTVELVPKEGGLWNTLGVAQYEAGDCQAAIESLEKSEQLTPDQNLGLNATFLAMAHWQLGHNEEARQWYKKAVQWMKKNKSQDEELGRFQAEAAALLKLPAPEPKTNRDPKPETENANPKTPTAEGEPKTNDN